MILISRVFVTALILCAFAVSAYASGNSYPRAFEATYDVTVNGKQVSTVQVLSDGFGHLRVQALTRESAPVTITDYVERTVTKIDPSRRAYYRRKLKDPVITDEKSALQAHARPLGARIVTNRHCHGFELKDSSTSAQNHTQIWIGDDTHYMVRQESVSPKSTQVRELKSWKDAVPSNLTAIPKDYKELKMPPFTL